MKISSERVVTYEECQNNHVAIMGNYEVDGSGESRSTGRWKQRRVIRSIPLIRTGLRNISTSYSRFSLADVARKLRLDSTNPIVDPESIVSKAIRWCN